MVLVGDITSTFIAGRILGCTVLTATDNDIKPRRLIDVICIIFSITLHLGSLIVFHVCIFVYSLEDFKGLIIFCIRVLLFYVCLITDSALTTLWNRKLRSVLSYLRNFDRATKYHDPSTGMKLRVICYTIVVISFVYWTVAGYLSYQVENKMPLFRASVYFAVDISIFIQVLTFACILFLIEERFRHLCNIVASSKEDKLIVSDRLNGHFTLQQIWWLHCSLVNAFELINSVYAIQLLLWISTMSFNVLSRLYALNVHKLSDYGKIRDLMVVIGGGWNLILITTVCHVTSRQANRVGELIFSPCSSVSMKRIFLQENLEAAAYFQLRKLHVFTIAGVIRIDLRLLLSIFSALTTYLVILT